MKIRKLVALTALSMALLSGTAMADSQGDKGKRDKMQHKGDRSEMIVERMTERLGLSEQQAIEVKSLMERHRNESNKALESQRLRFESELSSILTSEQKAMVKKNKERRKGKMKPRKDKGEGHMDKMKQKETHKH